MIPFLLIWYLWLKPQALEQEKRAKKDKFDPFVHWENLEQQVTSAVERFGYECERLEYFVKDEFQYKQHFDQMWKSSGKERPLLLFHGTLESNLPRIKEQGLLVPSQENGITVRNGDQHGVGIYLSNSNGVMTSLGYCDRSKLIVCAVIPHEHLLLNRNDVYVAFNSALVLPCFLVHLRYVGPRFQTYNPIKDYNPLPEAESKFDHHIYTFSSRSVYLICATLIFGVLVLLRTYGYSIPALDLLFYISANITRLVAPGIKIF